MEDQLKFDKSTFVCYKTTKINEEYLLGETLGQGAFGTVRKAVHKVTGQERAIKILKNVNKMNVNYSLKLVFYQN